MNQTDWERRVADAWASIDQYGEAEFLALIEQLAAESLAAYPPGVPNVLPGERLTAETLDYIQQALDHGVKVTGVSVHFVDEGVDSGPIILQRAVEVPESRRWEDLEERIHAVEHELLPEAIRLIAGGAVATFDAESPLNPAVEG